MLTREPAGRACHPTFDLAEGGGAYEYIRGIYDYSDRWSIDSLHSEYRKQEIAPQL